MPANWILSNGTVSKSLTEWGIQNPVITKGSLVCDEFTFTMPLADVFVTPSFTYGQTLSLSRNGVQVFQGKVASLPSVGSSKSEATSYIVKGPWNDLERLNYIQPRQIANVSGGSIVDFSSINTSQITLGAQASSGTIISAGDTIAAIVAFAVAHSASLVAGTVPAFFTIPIDVGRDITCAEAIKRCLAYDPTAVSWFDYSVTPPALNIVARSSLSVVNIDATAGNLISSLSISPRYDLVPTGVLFNYLTTVEANDGDIPTIVDQITPDSSGVTSGIGTVVATIELSRTAAGIYEPFPFGLAAYYYSQLQVVHYQGTIVLRGVDSPAQIDMGNTFNLINGQTAWASMIALIQTVSFNLDSGETEVDFGPPDHISPQDFVNLMMFNRRQQLPQPKSTFPLVQPPPDPLNPLPIPGRPANPSMQQHQLEVCKDGSVTTITYYGP